MGSASKRPPDSDSLTRSLGEDLVVAEIWEGRTRAEWQDRWGACFSRDGGVQGEPELHIFQSAGSTNTIARHLAEVGAPHGTIVIADLQTAGRGRYGRPFQAPAGTALLLSIVLRPPAPLGAGDAPGTLPLRIGLAVARAVDSLTGTELRLKWPNDLQVEGEGKLAGILCEGSLISRDGGYIVAGIGLNIRQERAELPASLGQPATSLWLATGTKFDRGRLATGIITEVARIGGQMIAPLGQTTLAELAARDPLLGKSLTVDGEPVGEGSGISPDGALLVRDHEGQIVHLRNGTIRLASRDQQLTDG